MELDEVFAKFHESEGAYVQGLRKRMRRCCCRYCGGKLEMRELTYSNCEMGRIELFCKDCGRMEYGVEPEIYEWAVNFVRNSGYDGYAVMEEGVEKERMNVARVCEIAGKAMMDLGIVDEEGFRLGIREGVYWLVSTVDLQDEDLR